LIALVAIATGVGIGFGLIELWDLDPGSLQAFLTVSASSGGLYLITHRISPRSKPAQAERQRRLMTLMEQTLPHLRLGLSEETAARTVRLLHESMRLQSVGITDRERLLAFAGPGADHHRPGDPIADTITKQAIEKRQIMAGSGRGDVDCNGAAKDCPLGSVVVAPLVYGDHCLATLKVYQAEEGPPEKNLIELTRGLAAILSLQLELAQAHREAQIADIAKLDALRAQMNPHFLFNTLNTIAMKARTDPEEARALLVRLSDFLRYAMKGAGHVAPFGEEYFFVRTYLVLEKARFGDRLQVRYDVDPEVLSIPVPVLTIQPLIENAVKHGIALQPDGGRVELRATLEPVGGTLRIKVTDDGGGMNRERLERLLTPIGPERSALGNIHERLIRLYRGRAALEIESEQGKGTTVTLSLPIG
jgi:LytS/YehU family sensor histidine kinase